MAILDCLVEVASPFSHHTVIVTDSRGHGRTTRDVRPYGYDLMADDVVALMDDVGFRDFERAMPYQMPRTLTADEVYALCAYILALNKIIGENDTINAETLPKVKMPNASNFIIAYPDRI